MSPEITQVEIREFTVLDIPAYYALCRDCGWRCHRKPHERQVLAVDHAKGHACATAQFIDDKGVPLAVGDRVIKTAIDDGAPMWAHHGTVAGFGRTRVRVRWDSWGYDGDMPFHAVRTERAGNGHVADALRKLI